MQDIWWDSLPLLIHIIIAKNYLNPAPGSRCLLSPLLNQPPPPKNMVKHKSFAYICESKILYMVVSGLTIRKVGWIMFFTTPLNYNLGVLLTLGATGYPGTHPTGYPGTRDICLWNCMFFIKLDKNFSEYAKFVHFVRYYKEKLFKTNIRKKNSPG